MKLSMWILSDWLNEYHPKEGITEGKMILQNIRLFSEDRRLSPNTVYLSGSGQDKSVLVNGHDLITLECGDLDRILNVILDAFEFYNDWENHLREAIQSGCEAEDLLRLGKRLLPEQLILADASFQVYAQATEGAAGAVLYGPQLTALPLEDLLAVNAQKDIRRQGIPPYTVPIPGHEEAITACNLFLSGRHIGWLVATSTQGNISRGRLDLLAEFGHFIESWIFENEKAAERLELTGPFLDILKGASYDESTILNNLQTLGWQKNDPKQVYVFRSEGTSRDSIHVLDGSLEHLNAYAFYFYFEDTPVLILNHSLTRPEDLEQDLARLLRLTNTIAGKSPVFTDIFTLPETYQAARISADYGAAPGKKQIFDFSDVVLSYIAFVLRSSAKVTILHPALSQLKQYDLRHDTSLWLTLKCFLEKESSYAATASALSIHRSTLLYRIERIQSLTKIDLASPSERLHLRISFLLESDMPLSAS